MALKAYETDRLLLRQWKQLDEEPFARMNSDPAVMEFFSSLRTRQESDRTIKALASKMKRDGFGFWAIDRKDEDKFIGFVGITTFDANLPFCPCVEIGWRLEKESWGQGFATEAARKSLEIGFEEYSLEKIYSFTPLGNMRSRRVMESIGMTDEREDFMHPDEPRGSATQQHCLYKIQRSDWQASKKS